VVPHHYGGRYGEHRLQARCGFRRRSPPGTLDRFQRRGRGCGSPNGAQAIGDWLRRRGDEVPHVYRVLNVEGLVPEGFRPAGPGVPADASTVRDVLRAEGVLIDARGRAAASQRFRVCDLS
jgi:alkylated DNA nucleotide flippase Atl1